MMDRTSETSVPRISDPGCAALSFPVVHDGSRWFELLFQSFIATGLATAAIATASIPSTAGIFLLLAVPFGGRALLWVWRRGAERLDLTDTDLIWQLGYARLRIPLGHINEVVPVTGIRLTTRVTPDLQIRTTTPVRWKAQKSSRWLWWLIWNSLPACPNGIHSGGPIQVFQISPQSPENLLEELRRRCPNLTQHYSAPSSKWPPESKTRKGGFG